MRWISGVALVAGVLCWSGCYVMRPSSGAGQTEFAPPRQVRPGDVALPGGYRIEAVVQGLTFPTGVVFDDGGRLHVVEAGYSYGEEWSTARLLRVEGNGNLVEIATGGRNGPWTGAAFHEGHFFIAEGSVLEGGRILRVAPDGQAEPIVDELPSLGDHHANGPVVSPDGWIYFGQGTASNSGVVGKDNFKFGWLKRRPDFHDVPGENIVLTGQNFRTENFLEGGGKVETGAFLPFGTPSSPGQVVKGAIKCSGGILRVRPDGSDLQLVAWGFRNPFGLAFSPGGELFVTDNGYDDRGSRPLWGTPDVFWQVRDGAWYGWPDFAAGKPVTHSMFKPPGGAQPQFLLAEHPGKPPNPVATFPVHSGAVGLDFSRSEAFGHAGEAFVALFGDEAPAVGKVLHPVGCKVVRVNPESGSIHDFAVNQGKVSAPASWLNRGGLERPVAVRFNPAGDAMFIVDFGVLLHSGKGARPVAGTGVIWKVTRE